MDQLQTVPELKQDLWRGLKQFLMHDLPNIFDCLLSRNYGEIFENARTISNQHHAASFLENLYSPFSILAVCEQVYFEMSFIGLRNVQNINLQDAYSQCVIDISSLKDNLFHATRLDGFGDFFHAGNVVILM